MHLLSADFQEAEAGDALRKVDVTACLPDSRDYTQYWHPYNIANPFVDYALKEQLLCIQTGHYGLALDLEKPAIKHLGAVDHANDYADSANEKDLVAVRLPDADLLMSVEVGRQDLSLHQGGGWAGPNWKRSDIPNYPRALDRERANCTAMGLPGFGF